MDLFQGNHARMLFAILFSIERAYSEQKYVLVIFLDISGAFHCTWHPSIVKSLIDKGIDGRYVHIIQDYLSNRQIRLKINNSTAQKNLSRSSPQGGGLSKFFWNSDFFDMLGEYDIDLIILSPFVDDC